MRIDYNKAAPAGIKALGGVYGYLTQCGLSAQLIELVYLRISQINGCAYCLDMHTRSLRKMGVKIEKLALLQVCHEAEALFDAEERAADFIKANVTKPVVGYVAGFTAPEGKTMGHAGAIVSGSSGTAQGKKDALEAAGVKVGQTPSETARLLRAIMGR